MLVVALVKTPLLVKHANNKLTKQAPEALINNIVLKPQELQPISSDFCAPSIDISCTYTLIFAYI